MNITQTTIVTDLKLWKLTAFEPSVAVACLPLLWSHLLYLRAFCSKTCFFFIFQLRMFVLEGHFDLNAEHNAAPSHRWMVPVCLQY